MNRITIGLATGALLWVASCAAAQAETVEIHAVGIDDYNGNGALDTNFSQITPWEDIGVDGTSLIYTSDPIAAVVSGEYQYGADCNQDGDVNLLDVNPFIAILGGG